MFWRKPNLMVPRLALVSRTLPKERTEFEIGRRKMCIPPTLTVLIRHLKTRKHLSAVLAIPRLYRAIHTRPFKLARLPSQLMTFHDPFPFRLPRPFRARMSRRVSHLQSPLRFLLLSRLLLVLQRHVFRLPRQLNTHAQSNDSLFSSRSFGNFASLIPLIPLTLNCGDATSSSCSQNAIHPFFRTIQNLKRTSSLRRQQGSSFWKERRELVGLFVCILIIIDLLCLSGWIGFFMILSNVLSFCSCSCYEFAFRNIVDIGLVCRSSCFLAPKAFIYYYKCRPLDSRNTECISKSSEDQTNAEL